MLRFSIIVPVYNAGEDLRRCVESILNQSYSSFEILLIDDGSIDDSLKICRELENKDNRIRVFHQENKGASAARNIGLENALGQYIQLVDSDDTITPDCLRFLNSQIEKYNNPDVIEFRLNYIGCNNVRNVQGTVLADGLYDKNFLKKEFMPVMLEIQKNDEMHYNIFNVLRVVKRALITGYNIRFNEKIRRWEDWLYAMEIFMHAEQMLVITKPLYNYYGHQGGGLGGRYNPNTFYYVVEAYKKVDDFAGKSYNMFSEYAIHRKIEQIERCMTEIFVNEKGSRRNDILLKTLQSDYLLKIMQMTTEVEGILFLRKHLKNVEYQKALKCLKRYFLIKLAKQDIKNMMRKIYYNCIRRKN